MFQSGDLLWIPQDTLMFTGGPNNPATIFRAKKPEVALFVQSSSHDPCWSVVAIDGKKWSIKTKNIRHLRRDNVSEINGSI